MVDKHLSTQFDSDLNAVSNRLMEMGGLVESQLRDAIEALASFDNEASDRAIAADARVNAMEVSIDRDLMSIIGRRQPTARDLRLLMAISRVTANLERLGDEAQKIARMVKSITASGAARSLPSGELRLAVDLASKQLHKSLDGFARLDTSVALAILREDNAIDQEFNGFIRILVTYMMEDPRTISPSLDLLFVAKALERVGDHAKNIAESIIYIVEGTDVRHTALSEIESALN